MLKRKHESQFKNKEGKKINRGNALGPNTTKKFLLKTQLMTATSLTRSKRNGHTSTQEQTQFSPCDASSSPIYLSAQPPTSSATTTSKWQEFPQIWVTPPPQKEVILYQEAHSCKGPLFSLTGCYHQRPTKSQFSNLIAYQPSSILSSSQLRFTPNAKVANMTYCDTPVTSSLLENHSTLGCWALENPSLRSTPLCPAGAPFAFPGTNHRLPQGS